ncbi:MAG TPA: hypothetical protein VJW23_10190 [Propionibacteriaceae bacterium]|nr:hypothetical protein [Propionibacteriaceae bacterium]
MTTSKEGTTRVPDKTQLKNYLAKGLTQQQIVDAWEVDSNIRVSRSAIGMAIRRYDLASSRPRPNYMEMIPWRIRWDHRMAWDVRMLRLEARRRRGEALTDKEKRDLTQWRSRLDEANAVVIYERDTEEGFLWVGRTPEDDDIIRRP